MAKRSKNKNYFEKTVKGRGSAKRAVLDQYLSDWLSVIGRERHWNTNILYIDGFSGSGTYKADENEIATPVQTYNIIADHCHLKNIQRKNNFVDLIFVEKESNRAAKLNLTLEKVALTKSNQIRKTGNYTNAYGGIVAVANEYIILLANI